MVVTLSCRMGYFALSEEAKASRSANRPRLISERESLIGFIESCTAKG